MQSSAAAFHGADGTAINKRAGEFYQLDWIAGWTG
jgi:hypothetical protein